MSGILPNSIDRYLADISALPLLSAEDEKALAREIRKLERVWRSSLLAAPASAAALAELWSTYRGKGRKSSRLLSSTSADVDQSREKEASRLLDGLEQAVARRRRNLVLKSRESIARSDALRKGKLERLELEIRVLEDVQHRLQRSLEHYADQVGEAPAAARETLERSLRDYAAYREKREAFVTSNVKLVVYIAKGFVNRGLPLEDLIQDGNFGLLRAVEKFDPGRGVRFSSYASFWIKQAVSRAIEMKSRVIRTPTSLGSRMRSLAREDAQRVARGDVELTLDEKSNRFGMESGDFQSLLSAFRPSVSLDYSPLEDGEPLVQLLAAKDDDLLDYLEQRERCEQIHQLLDRLNARERMIVERRYGLRGELPETLESIGGDLGLSRERIRQLEKLALERLREEAGAT